MAKNQQDDVLSHVNEKKWKYLSIVLMGILATGLLAPQAYADTLSTIQSIVTDIQSKVNNSTYGLQAIKNAITGVKTDTQIIRGDLYTFKTTAEPKLTNLQTSVNTLQTTATGIDTKVTDIQTKVTALGSGGGGGGSNNLSALAIALHCGQYRVAPLYVPFCDLFHSNLVGVNLSGADISGANLGQSILENANLSGANLEFADVSSSQLFGANLSGANFSHANLSNSDLASANLSGTDFSNANLTGVTFAGCTGTPIGTPNEGTLPTCS